MGLAGSLKCLERVNEIVMSESTKGKDAVVGRSTHAGVSESRVSNIAHDNTPVAQVRSEC